MNSEPHDFGTVVIHVPIGDPSDLMDAYAALNNILINCKNAMVLVNVNWQDGAGDFFAGRHMQVLDQMAELNNNHLVYVRHKSIVSLARMVYDSFSSKPIIGNRKWMLNHDCDLMLTGPAFEALSTHAIKFEEPAVYQFFDIANVRNYPDYDAGWDNVRQDIDERDMCFRRSSCHPYPHKLSSQVWTGAFMVPLPLDPKLMEAMRVWPKGQRGYDRAVLESCKVPYLLRGAVAYHKGVNTPLLSKRWTEFKDDVSGLSFIPSTGEPNV